MKTISAYVYGKEYMLACDDGQEAHLNYLVAQVNARAERLEKAVGKLPEAMMLLYTALMTADELHDAGRDSTRLKDELSKAKRQAELQLAAEDSDDGRLEALETEVAENLHELAARLDGLAKKLAA